jgi:hypothetical protein
MTLLVTILLALVGAGEVLAFQFGRIGAQGLVIGAHVGTGLALLVLVVVIATAVLV